MSFDDGKDDLAFGQKIRAVNLAPLSMADANKTLIWDGSKWTVGVSGGMSDLEFLQKKLDEGKIVTVTNTRGSIGEICSITPPAGQTFYHVKSYITSPSIKTPPNAYTNVLVQVINDGNTIDYLAGSDGQHESYQTTAWSGARPQKVETTIPAKLVGDGTKKFALNVQTINNMTVYGTIIGYYAPT